MKKNLKFLLINPPVYDFSAYDAWAKPLGLLYISNILKQLRYEVVLIDCMDRNLQGTPSKSNGTGKFLYEIVPKPEVFSDVPLHYKRYGITRKQISEILSNNKDADFVLITSVMTYWYLGVQEVIFLVKEFIPDAKIVLGGILPTLLPSFTYLFFGNTISQYFAGNRVGDFIATITSKNEPSYQFNEFQNFPAPDYSFYKNLSYVVIRTSYGCFYNCDYCSCRKIIPHYQFKDPQKIASEINFLYNISNTQNFVFYDDALFNVELNKTKDLFYELLKLPFRVKYYTPNGISPKFIDKEFAKLLFDLNFVDLRLSLETTNDNVHSIVDKKIDLKNFLITLENLFAVGFRSDNISVYILAGLPQEKIEDVYRSAELLHKYGLRIRLCELSPVPKSKLFYYYNLDKNTDPLYYNNTTFLFTGIPRKVSPWCSYEELQNLKSFIKNLNKNLEEKDVRHTCTSV